MNRGNTDAQRLGGLRTALSAGLLARLQPDRAGPRQAQDPSAGLRQPGGRGAADGDRGGLRPDQRRRCGGLVSPLRLLRSRSTPRATFMRTALSGLTKVLDHPLTHQICATVLVRRTRGGPKLLRSRLVNAAVGTGPVAVYYGDRGAAWQWLVLAIP